LSSIRNALPRNHLPGSPPCHSPGCRAKAHDSGTNRISGFGSRPEPASVSQPWQRKAPRVLPRRRRKAFTHPCIPWGAVLTFNPRPLISFAAFLLPRRRYPLSSQLLGKSPWGWKSDDHRCCKNGAGCSLVGLWQRTDHCGYFLNGIRAVPAQPVAKAAKIARRVSATLRPYTLC
jgi:hypothetical protein